MMTHTKTHATLADVLDRLRSLETIPAPKRYRMANALNTLWRYSGRPLAEISATMPALRDVLKDIEPAAHGVKPATVANMRNLIMHAMKDTGLNDALASYCTRRIPYNAEWSNLLASTLSDYEKNCLWSLARYGNDHGYHPTEIDDGIFEAFSTALEQTSFRRRLDTIKRNAAKCWNVLRERHPKLRLKPLTPPASRTRRLSFAMSDFPKRLQHDFYSYREWLISENLFDEGARPRRVSSATASNYTRRIHRALNLLATIVGSPEQVTRLRALFDLRNYREVLNGLYKTDRSADKAESFQTALTLLQLARDYLSLDADWLQQLEQIRKRLRRPRLSMTEKNKRLMSQFDDPAVLRRLMEAPEQIWKDMHNKKISPRNRLAQAEAALALSILPYMPLRLQNLTDFEFGKSIILCQGGTSSISIPEDRVKAGRSIEFEIPDHIASKLFEFHDVIACRALGKHPRWLFSNIDGSQKGFAQVRYLTQRYFKKHVGFHMNPHAFRHLCAKLILDAHPGAHTLVQELLGHKSVETSTAFYAGFNSRRAGRHHSELMQRELASGSHRQTRSRRRLVKDF